MCKHTEMEMPISFRREKIMLHQITELTRDKVRSLKNGKKNFKDFSKTFDRENARKKVRLFSNFLPKMRGFFQVFRKCADFVKRIVFSWKIVQNIEFSSLGNRHQITEFKDFQGFQRPLRTL